MRKRTLCIILCIITLCSLLVGASAYGEEYSDLPVTYWAYPEMSRAASLGIINGVGDGKMDPQGTLTHAQCLTMLGRAFAPERYRSYADSGYPWDEAGYLTALFSDFLLMDDFLPINEATLHDPITRAETAVLLSRVLPEENIYSASSSGAAAEKLSDFDTMDGGYAAAVSRLYDLGIIKGKEDGTFGPEDTLRRSDGTVLLMRTLSVLDSSKSDDNPVIILIFVDSLTGEEILTTNQVCSLGDSLLDLAEKYAPQGYEADYIYDYGVVTSAGSSYRIPLIKLPDVPASPTVGNGDRAGTPLYELGWNRQKSLLLFGNEEQIRYSSREAAEANMTKIEVPIWRLRDGVKVEGTATIMIHRAVADEVVAIFTEIFNDPEQFPICTLQGYDWRGDSAKGEHNTGTAIDINFDQNCQIKNGKVLAGSYWRPGEDPYSIPEDGSVVRIFAAHGWSWGGNAWPSSKDYMHFSYMGR